MTKRSRRTARAQYSYECIEIILASLSFYVYRGLLYKKEQHWHTCSFLRKFPSCRHYKKWRYIMSEIRWSDLILSTSVSYGEKKSCSCSLSLKHWELCRTITMTSSWVSRRSTKNNGNAMYADEMILTFVFFQSNLSLTGIHPCINVYVLFRFEPIHRLFLLKVGIWNECMIITLCNRNRTTSFICYTNGKWDFLSHRANCAHTFNL